MPYLQANNLRFHVQVLTRPQPATAPTRPEVVMVHGMILVNLASFYHTIAHPVAQVADTYLYDLRGNGRTDMPPSGYAVSDHVADLRSLLTAWRIVEPVHLVANSFGGAIAVAFAHQYPEMVASLMIIDGALDAYLGEGGTRLADAYFAADGRDELPSARTELQRGEYTAALATFGLDEQTVDGWLEPLGPRKRNSVTQLGKRLFLETSLVNDFRREQPVTDEVLQSIGCPTLAIYGEGSDMLGNAYALEEHVPHCELHIVPDSTHLVLLEAAPTVADLVVSWITRFAKRTGPRVAAGDRP